MYLVNRIASRRLRISTQMPHRQPDSFPPAPRGCPFLQFPRSYRGTGEIKPRHVNLQISVWEGFYLTEASLQNYSGHSPYPILY